MQLRHIVAAADESDAGRRAVRTASELASRAAARVTIIRVITLEARQPESGGTPPLYERIAEQTDLMRLHQWLEVGVLAPDQVQAVKLAIGYGIPSVEICRLAERAEADLVVLGRKRHTQMMRLMLGDTADAVARRSRSPCLIVAADSDKVGFNKVLVALDASDRGISVLSQGCRFARYAGATVEALTVEPRPAGEPESLSALPLSRTSLLQARAHEVLKREGFPEASLTIHQGYIPERVLAEAEKTNADVLTIGYHRGGPPGVLEAGSTARRVAHAAPCAVLTIPL